MDSEIDTEKKKKKKKRSGIIIVLIIIIAVLLFLRISKVGSLLDDPTMTPYEMFWFFVIAIIVVGCFFGFAMLPKKIRRYTAAWIRQSFVHIVWPSLFLIIILMGAITEKYPPNYEAIQQATGNYTAPFDVNVNQSFSMMGITLAKAFQRIVMTFYDMGARHPDFWIFMSIMFIIISVILMIDSVKDDINDDMTAQELIDSITDKDYEDLERFENKKTQPWNFKKDFRGWLLIFAIVFTAIIGLWLWFK